MSEDWTYLLNRPEIQFDQTAIGSAIRGRRVLVTGAGGSIGTHLVQRLRDLGPDRLVALDAHEASLWRLRHGLDAVPTSVDVQYVLAGVRDKPKLASVFRQHRCGRGQ